MPDWLDTVGEFLDENYGQLPNAVRLAMQGPGGTASVRDPEELIPISEDPDAGMALTATGEERPEDIAAAATQGMDTYNEAGVPAGPHTQQRYVSRREAPGDRVGDASERYSFYGTQSDADERREAAEMSRSLAAPIEAVEDIPVIGDVASLGSLATTIPERAARGMSHEAALGGWNSQVDEALEMLGVDTGRFGEGTENMMVEARRRGDTEEIIAGQAFPWLLSAPAGAAAATATGLTRAPALARAVGVTGDALAGYLGGRGYAQESLGENENTEGIIGGLLGGGLGGLLRYGLAGRGGREGISKMVPRGQADGFVPPQMEGPGIGAMLPEGPARPQMEGPARLPRAADNAARLDGPPRGSIYRDAPQPQGRASAVDAFADTPPPEPVGDWAQQASPRHQEMAGRVRAHEGVMDNVLDNQYAQAGEGIVRGQGRGGVGAREMDAPIAPEDVLESLSSDAYIMEPPPVPARGREELYDPRFDYVNVPEPLPEITPEQARAMAAGVPDARPLPTPPSDDALAAAQAREAAGLDLMDEYMRAPDAPPALAPGVADVPPSRPRFVEPTEMPPEPEGLQALLDDLGGLETGGGYEVPGELPIRPPTRGIEGTVDHPRFDRMERPRPEIPNEQRRVARRRERDAGREFRNQAGADRAQVYVDRIDGGGAMGLESMASIEGGEVARPAYPRLLEFAQAREAAAALADPRARRAAERAANNAIKREFPEWWSAGGSGFTRSWRGGGRDGARALADIKPSRADRGEPIRSGGPSPEELGEEGIRILRGLGDRWEPQPSMRYSAGVDAPPETAFGRAMAGDLGDKAVKRGGYAQLGGLAAVAGGNPGLAATGLVGGTAMRGLPRFAKALDNMIARGRYGNIGPLTAIRDAIRAGRGQEARALIATHTAMLEDPEFRQAYRAAERDIGPSDTVDYGWEAEQSADGDTEEIDFGWEAVEDEE